MMLTVHLLKTPTLYLNFWYVAQLIMWQLVLNQFISSQAWLLYSVRWKKLLLGTYSSLPTTTTITTITPPRSPTVVSINYSLQPGHIIHCLSVCTNFYYTLLFGNIHIFTHSHEHNINLEIQLLLMSMLNLVYSNAISKFSQSAFQNNKKKADHVFIKIKNGQVAVK